MNSHGETADLHAVPPWTSAIDPAPEDDTSAPLMWSMLAMKLDEAADLGSRIRVREVEAKVTDGSVARDELSREVLLETCGLLKDCLKKLSKSAADEHFEQLCAKVMSNSSTRDAAMLGKLRERALPQACLQSG